jgi:hypothetical protein
VHAYRVLLLPLLSCRSSATLPFPSHYFGFLDLMTFFYIFQRPTKAKQLRDSNEWLTCKWSVFFSGGIVIIQRKSQKSKVARKMK